MTDKQTTDDNLPTVAEVRGILKDYPPTTLDTFLDTLPARASVVCGGERIRDKSDAQLQAWAWGVEDAIEAVKELIADWRSAHD